MDVRTQPLIAQQGNIRTEPFAQPTPDPAKAGLPSSVAKTLGEGSSSPAQSPDANQDGELDAEELGHLQDAAANGDKESWDFLNALKLPLGVAAGAAALYGAARGGLTLTDAIAKARGINMDPRVTEPTVDPSHKVAGLLTGPSNRVAAPPAQKLLPAPANGPIPGQAPAVEPRLEDLRTPYSKSGGKLPSGSAASEAIRAAAKAAGRMH